jgi:DNA-binding response OmpR family regulator
VVITGESRASQRVLIVEDDPTVADVVSRYLEQEGFTSEIVSKGSDALDRARKLPPDLVLLDLMLPGMDGLEVCRLLRAEQTVPIIMLTALGEESDKIIGLETGADDYLSKPFSPKELVARAKAVLRRASNPLAGREGVVEPMAFSGLEIDPAAREVRTDGELVQLTSREFDLLLFLAVRARTAFTREELLEKVWGYRFGDTSTITVHVRRLREKIERDPTSPRHLVTVWGVGYRFDS